MEIHTTEIFDAWMAELDDDIGRGKIVARIQRMSLGNMGDVASVGGGVSELRIQGKGPGYRVYLKRRGEQVVILLCGGDKSTQAADIKQAKAIAAAL